MSSILHSPTLPQSAALRSFAAQWGTRAADRLLPLREQALQRFLKLGLPTTRDETWRHTNLRALAAQTFVDAPRKIRGEIEPNASFALLSKADRAASLLMVTYLYHQRSSCGRSRRDCRGVGLLLLVLVRPEAMLLLLPLLALWPSRKSDCEALLRPMPSLAPSGLTPPG